MPRIIDPQSLRFTGSRFLETEALRRLPHAPASPLSAHGVTAQDARTLTRSSMLFAQDRGTDVHLVPGLPLYDYDQDAWLRSNDLILRSACAHNGGEHVDRKPLLALVAPGPKAMAKPDALIERLLDHPVAGLYVQPINFNPTADSLEKLARVVQFVAQLQAAGFKVIVGRVGAFGLILQALGIPVFDSGIGMAEAHDLASLNRVETERAKSAAKEKGGGGAAGRVYVEPLKTTMPAKVAAHLVRDESVRHHFACNLGCCRFRALEDLPSRARPHYLYVRRAEVDQMRKLEIAAMRLHHVETKLRAAQDLSEVARRSFETVGLHQRFDHIERWLGLLAREQGLALAS